MSYPDLHYKIAILEGLLLSLGKIPKKIILKDVLFAPLVFLQLEVNQNSKSSTPMQLSTGKGANQAVAAKRLGAAVRFVGRLGRDGHGEWCHGGELGG